VDRYSQCREKGGKKAKGFFGFHMDSSVKGITPSESSKYECLGS